MTSPKQSATPPMIGGERPVREGQIGEKMNATKYEIATNAGPSSASPAGRDLKNEPVTEKTYDQAMSDLNGKTVTRAIEVVAKEIGFGRNKLFALQMELAGTPCNMVPSAKQTGYHEDHGITWADYFGMVARRFYSEDN